MKYFLLIFFFYSTSSWTQKIEVSVDSTKTIIGKQLEFEILIETDSIIEIQTEKNPIFYPFEVIDESLIDTIRKKNNYLYQKKYSLISFDSGKFWIPPQKLYLDKKVKTTDSILIEISNVKVDTLKQSLFDIKPIIEVDKNYDNFFYISIILLGLILMIFLIWLIFKKIERFKTDKNELIHPFDKAIKELDQLEKIELSDQNQYKLYYSRLTDVVRRYLEEEANVSALESTSEELLKKLEKLKREGKMQLMSDTIKDLKKVLINADLVKFAKSSPEFFVANEDRALVKKVVIKTKESLPEPTKEELELKESYRRNQMIKKRKNQLKFGILTIFSSIILITGASMIFYGYYPVRDELLQYPTKKLLSGNWILSQYGTPPVEIETPSVLVRNNSNNDSIKVFRFKGKWDRPFSIELKFSPPIIDEIKEEYSSEEKGLIGQNILEKITSDFENEGAVNILPKNEEFNTKSGIEGIKFYGSLDLKNVRCSFFSIAFVFNEVFVELKMIYDKEDRYGKKIEDRILDSLEIIEEL